MATNTSRSRQPQIYFLGGLAYVILFGVLMLTAVPPSEFIVPPLMIGIRVIEMVIPAIIWHRSKQRYAR